MSDTNVRILLRAATADLACPRCGNTGYTTNGHGEKDECSHCYGNKKNEHLISLLKYLVVREEERSATATSPQEPGAASK